MKVSKAQRNEERRREAIRRLRLHTFIAILIPIMDAWELGMKGGGKKVQMEYKAIDVPPKVASYIKMMSGKINKARDEVVRLLGVESFDVGMAFYRTADDKLQEMSEACIKHLPEDASRYDQMRVMTYLMAAAFHDLRIITQDHRPEVKRLATAIESLANYLIKPDSHLIQPMSNAYWETRDVVQEFPDWTCDGTIEWSPSEQDKYLQGKVA